MSEWHRRRRTDPAEILGRISCAVPLFLVGAVIFLLGFGWEVAVIDAATNPHQALGSCDATGSSSLLIGVAVVGLTLILAAALALFPLITRREARAATWGKLLIMGVLIGGAGIVYGISFGEGCPLLN
jgi:hypothetical protein